MTTKQKYHAHKILCDSSLWRNKSTLPEMLLPVMVKGDDYMGDWTMEAWRQPKGNGRNKPPTHWGWRTKKGWVHSDDPIERWMPMEEAERILRDALKETPPHA